jgi:hypothetical protein
MKRKTFLIFILADLVVHSIFFFIDPNPFASTLLHHYSTPMILIAAYWLIYLRPETTKKNADQKS